MTSFLTSGRALAATFMVLLAGAAAAQAPTITQVLPVAHAVSVPGTTIVAASLSQPLTAASAGALKVFSSQRGGLRSAGGSGAVTVANNTLVFSPTYGFRPGETVQVSLTTATQSTGGATLAAPRVWEFTASAGGNGTGAFTTLPTVMVRVQPAAVALGDVDNDGDLDLVAVHPDASAVVRFNSGQGNFTTGGQVTVGNSPIVAKMADVDGDGDLDLLVLNSSGNSVSVRFNDGLGTFTGTQNVAVDPGPTDLAVGDVDGDGDLDLVTSTRPNPIASTSETLRLNNGAGVFGGGGLLRITSGSGAIALADLDNDGDLDLVVSENSNNRIYIRRNDGRGTFTGISQFFTAGAYVGSIAVGDVDHDGFVDLVLGQEANPNIYIVHNNAGSTFTIAQTIVVGATNSPVRLADVDADGDLDILAAVRSTATAAIFYNTGPGTFGLRTAVNGLTDITDIAVGDLDNDGDLDFAAPNYGRFSVTVNVRLNNGTRPTATAPGAAPLGFALSPNPATTAFALTGLPAGTPVQVLDALGREVLAVALPASGTVALPAGLAAGLYVVRAVGSTRRLAVD